MALAVCSSFLTARAYLGRTNRLSQCQEGILTCSRLISTAPSRNPHYPSKCHVSTRPHMLAHTRGVRNGARLQASKPDSQGVSATQIGSKETELSGKKSLKADLDFEFEEELEVDGRASGSDTEDSEIDEELEAIKRSLGPELELDLEVAEEEWDEDELDELFEEFGETIVQSEPTVDSSSAASSKSPTDEESQELAVGLATVASDTKAGNIRVLDVRPLVYWTQFFVVATAFSRPQMDAMAKRMSDLAEEKYGRSLRAPERQAPGPWTLLDYGDVVVHLFAPRERERYAIEEFYANAQEVELPFPQVEPNYS